MAFFLVILFRDWQPLVGAVGKTCKQDERLLQAIAETNPFVEYLQASHGEPP